MRKETKKRMTVLLEELLSDDVNENRQSAIAVEINKLSPDSKWSDYIFWSDDYLNGDGSLNYEKFFKKIFKDS